MARQSAKPRREHRGFPLGPGRGTRLEDSNQHAKHQLLVAHGMHNTLRAVSRSPPPGVLACPCYQPRCTRPQPPRPCARHHPTEAHSYAIAPDGPGGTPRRGTSNRRPGRAAKLAPLDALPPSQGSNALTLKPPSQGPSGPLHWPRPGIASLRPRDPWDSPRTPRPGNRRRESSLSSAP